MPTPKGPKAGKKADKKLPAAVSPSKKKSPPARKMNHPDPDGAFTVALAGLLRSRKLAVPKGLETAPPEAYASQPASFVDQLKRLSDAELKVFAEKISNYAARQLARSKAAWDSSPLIIELRRRKLKEPAVPKRGVGVSVSLRKPLKDWSDAQIVKAANEWSKRGA